MTEIEIQFQCYSSLFHDVTSFHSSRAMRRYLCQIFSMSLSSLPCPLEFFIASVVGQVPLPVAGGRPFHVVQDAALISSTSCAMNAIEFEVPLPR